jgi:hypothetical protein
VALLVELERAVDGQARGESLVGIPGRQHPGADVLAGQAGACCELEVRVPGYPPAIACSAAAWAPFIQR